MVLLTVMSIDESGCHLTPPTSSNTAVTVPTRSIGSLSHRRCWRRPWDHGTTVLEETKSTHPCWLVEESNQG
jgi:hypothetical protein